MKILITFCGLILFSFSVKAQNSNAVFFTENGERFQIVLNGIVQNAKAETNVKLTQLTENHYKCRIIFEDTKLGYTDFNLFFPDPGDEVTWNIKKNTSGEYVARFISAVPIEETPKTIPTDPVYIFSEAPDSETTTTTTTNTITTSSASVLISHNPEYLPGYTGKTGCPEPANPDEFSQMKKTIKSEDFENTKLTVAKQILQNNCLTSSQVREILGLFDFENTKLDFAKYAYDRTFDVGNYYKVNDAFQFESSVDELNKYISKK